MYNKYKNNSILSFYYEQNKMLESRSKFVMGFVANKEKNPPVLLVPPAAESQHSSTEKLSFLSPSIASHFEISAETAAAAAPAVPLQ